MVNFTDKHLYLKGTCQVNVTDPCDGTVLYSSNKFQTANITTSVSLGEIRAGMGNSIATLLPSDSALNVEFTAADFNLWAKSAQLGATVSYGAPAQTCETVTADQNGTVTVSGEPVAGLGFPSPFAYVQEVGVAGSIGQTGTPYPVNGKEIVYTGQAGKQYLVNYYTRRVDAQVATIGTLFNPKVVHFTAQMPVFRNDSCTSNEGSRVGWLYVIVPRLKLGANGGIVGDQSAADTTSLSGQAIAYDDENATMCGNCSTGVLSYYTYVPDNEAENIQGVAIVGGYINVPEGQTVQIPVRLVMENGQLVVPADYESNFTYMAVNPPTGTTVSPDGKITAGTEAGDFELIIRYNNEGEILTTSAVVSVQAISVIGIYINGGSIVVEEGTTEQIVTEIEMSDGTIITPTDFQTGFTYTADSLPDGTSISADGVITGGTVPGTFTVTVSYTSGGRTFTATAQVTVNAELKPLDYTSMYVLSIPAPLSEPVTVSGTANRYANYTFDWGDGTRETKILNAGATETHTYTAPGDYILSVRDNAGSASRMGSFLVSRNPYVVEILIDTTNSGLTLNQPADWTAFKKIEIGSHCQDTLSLSGFPALEEITYYYTPPAGSSDYTSVKAQAAYNLPSLKKLVFHTSAIRFNTGGTMIANVPQLETLDLSHVTSVPPLSNSAYLAIPSTTQILVPEALLSSFKTATNWSTRARQFVGV